VDAADDEHFARARGVAAFQRDDPGAADGAAEEDRPPNRRQREADVQVVVVVREDPDDAPRPGQVRCRADEDADRAGADEAAHEVLSQRVVDLGRVVDGALAAVAARVVHVDVEPVLVRGVADAPELRAEVAAVRAAQVADADARRPRVRGGVRVDDPKDGADDASIPEPAPASVGLSLENGIPREEVPA
jgi:hypothetical protein